MSAAIPLTAVTQTLIAQTQPDRTSVGVVLDLVETALVAQVGLQVLFHYITSHTTFTRKAKKSGDTNMINKSVLLTPFIIFFKTY